jgi:hypothetical protein
MTVADKLEKLARMLPGVAGYQDRETARDTDHALRQRLTAELGRMKRKIEEITRRQAEQRAFATLPPLDRLSVKIEKLGNLVRFASRGYRGVFDAERLTQDRLQRLYGFDLELLHELDGARAGVDAVCAAEGESTALDRAVRALNTALEELEQSFGERDRVIKADEQD